MVALMAMNALMMQVGARAAPPQRARARAPLAGRPRGALASRRRGAAAWSTDRARAPPPLLPHAPCPPLKSPRPRPRAPARPPARPQMAVLFPATYVKWREPLCVWSHVAHKLAQTAVTLVPPVGTIFSGETSMTFLCAEPWAGGLAPEPA